MKTSMLLSFAMLFVANTTHACITAETENNDSEANANGAVCTDVLVEGSINNRRDQDWYFFSVENDGEITIVLDHNSRDDFDWDLYRTSGAAVASGASSQIPETGSYSASRGNYYLKVSRYSGTGWYDLTVSFPDSDAGDTACSTYGSRPSKPNSIASYVVGSNNDVCPALPNQGAVLLMGGGADVDASFSQRVMPHINGGDVVVLRTSGTDAYNDYLLPLTGADSVETIIVDSVADANSSYVDWAVRSAEFVFVSGGDQSEYLNLWEGTKLQQALDHVFSKNGVVGGTSAGNAIQGEYVYDPDGVLGAISEEVVTDLCHSTMKLSPAFLQTPVMSNIITDTHFYERDRMGRMAVMLANIGLGKQAIGVDEATAMFVTNDGNAVIDGTGRVYVLTTDNQSRFDIAQCGSPVVLNDLVTYDLRAGDSFNLLTGQSSRSFYRISIDGRATRFYSPSNPY